MKNKIHLLKNKFRAILFDFDGTLMDTMPAHNKAWIETMQKYNVNITEEELQSLAGTPNYQTAVIFCQKYNISEDPKKIDQLKTQRAEELLEFSKTHIEVEEVVKQALGHFKMAIVSGSQKHLILPSIHRLKLNSYFEAIVSCEDTEKGKPHPDPFLLGAKLLSVSPEHCLVFEDGLLGLEAAQKANMKTLFVENGKIKWDKFN